MNKEALNVYYRKYAYYRSQGDDPITAIRKAAEYAGIRIPTQRGTSNDRTNESRRAAGADQGR